MRLRLRLGARLREEPKNPKCTLRRKAEEKKYAKLWRQGAHSGRALPLTTDPSPIFYFPNCTSMDLLTDSIGFRLKLALMVTFLPDKFWGTRHECEQMPLHPNSILPESTCLPSDMTAKVGPGGVTSPPLLLMR